MLYWKVAGGSLDESCEDMMLCRKLLEVDL
jgi:hypothetical protein